MFNLKFYSKSNQIEHNNLSATLPGDFIPFGIHELSAIMGGCEENVTVLYDNLDLMDLSEDE